MQAAKRVRSATPTGGRQI